MTLVSLLLASSFAYTEDIERITVTGQRHHWPDSDIRQFYIHYASLGGLKTVPTANDFEKFNDDKLRKAIKEQRSKSTKQRCLTSAVKIHNTCISKTENAAAIGYGLMGSAVPKLIKKPTAVFFTWRVAVHLQACNRDYEKAKVNCG